MCPNCEKKDKKIFELSLRLGAKKRQVEQLEEKLEFAKTEIYTLRLWRQPKIINGSNISTSSLKTMLDGEINSKFN